MTSARDVPQPAAEQLLGQQNLRHTQAETRWQWLRKRLNPELAIGLTILLIVIMTSVFAPVIAWNSPTQSVGASLSEPELRLPFGTDSIGRDVFSRVLHAGRVSLLVAIPSVMLALALGLALGVPSGYLGGRVDQFLMRSLDVIFAFPAILLAIIVVSILGSSIQNLIITIGIIYTPRMARIVRAPILSVKERDFVGASRAVGATEWRLVLRHVLPNASAPVIVEISLALSQIMITEAALSFLGLGPPPPNPSWGAMLSDSRQFMQLAPWNVLAPGIAIVVAVSSFQLIGHGLHRALDPHQLRH